MKILFIGDIYGKLGRETVKKLLPRIKREHKPDFIIANGENAAHGSGLTKQTLYELFDLDIDVITMGDHAFDRPRDAEEIYESGKPIIRPANYPPTNPGKGFINFTKNNQTITVINLLGRVNMNIHPDCPFRGLDAILEEINLANIKTSAIIVDMHAETTAEKICFGHYADGRVSAVLGTHTHIPTADARLLPKRTAYITDTGMVGAYNESIGLDLENSIRTLIDQIKHQRVIPEKGQVQFNAVLVEIDEKKNKAKSIQTINLLSEIK